VLTILAASGVGFEDAADFVTHAAEDGHLFFVGAFGVGGIVEAPVVAIHLTGEHGAHLICIAADSDDGLHVLGEELIEVLRVMRRDVDADFLHGCDGERVDVACGLRASAGHADNAFGGCTEDAFG